MLKRTTLSIMLLFSFSFYGQNASTTASSSAIEANFSVNSIKVYQESALLKIEDYYNHLALLSNTSTPDALKIEIKAALFSLFKSNYTTVFDFTQEGKKTIPLLELVEKIKNKNYSFAILNATNSFLSDNFWTTAYTLEIRKKENNQLIKCVQKVYFTPSMKQFGPAQKEVWTIKLGGVE